MYCGAVAHPFCQGAIIRKQEIDLIIDQGTKLKAFEIKSGKTIQSDFFKALIDFQKLHADTDSYLVYGGDEVQKRSQALSTIFYAY